LGGSDGKTTSSRALDAPAEKDGRVYTRVFEMKEMFRTKNGSIHLSDGEVNMALLNANDPKDPNDKVEAA
jgi:hypothetical protein